MQGIALGDKQQSVEFRILGAVQLQVNDREHWVRTFGKKSFSSYQYSGKGRDCHLVVERFGIVSVALAVVAMDDRLYFIPRRWKMLGIPLPVALAPSGNSFEYQENGVFKFHVEIRVPLVGLIVAYKGWLEPKLSNDFASVSPETSDLLG